MAGETPNPDLEGEKVWWQSRRIWGALVTIAAGLISLVTGAIMTPAEQEHLLGHVMQIMTIVGGIVAWYGGWKAEKKISNKIF